MKTIAETDYQSLIAWVRSHRLEPTSAFTPNSAGLRDARESIAYRVSKSIGLDIVRARELVRDAGWSP